MNNIQCPKCGSEQITSNKKGWSLTTGVIGMNNIILTCLKCGKQFKPGEDLDAKNAKDLQRKAVNAKIAKNPVFKVVAKIVFGLLAFMILLTIYFSIFDHSDNKTDSSANPISDSAKLQLDKYYTIEKEDNDATNIRLFLYVSDTSKITNINQFLIDKYNNDKSKYVGIYYFDKKGIGNTYLNKQMSENVSEKEKSKLLQHFIAVYSFNPSNSFEKLEFKQHTK